MKTSIDKSIVQRVQSAILGCSMSDFYIIPMDHHLHVQFPLNYCLIISEVPPEEGIEGKMPLFLVDFLEEHLIKKLSTNCGVCSLQSEQECWIWCYKPSKPQH